MLEYVHEPILTSSSLVCSLSGVSRAFVSDVTLKLLGILEFPGIELEGS